jgi:hypothetical protein
VKLAQRFKRTFPAVLANDAALPVPGFEFALISTREGYDFDGTGRLAKSAAPIRSFRGCAEA